MTNKSYIFLCELRAKSTNNFTDIDLDHYLEQYESSPSVVLNNEQFSKTYKGIKQLMWIHSLYIQKSYGMLSGIIGKVYCYDTKHLEDKIFDYLEHINLHLDEPIKSTKIQAVCDFGYLLSSHNSVNPHMIDPCPSDTMVMALSIFNGNLKNTPDAEKLVDMWIEIWQIASLSHIPDREIISKMVAQQIQNAQRC